jgi:hypothetical protein
MSIDVNRPVRLKSGGPPRTLLVAENGMFVVLSKDGTFAHAAPVTREHVIEQYENVPEAVPEPPPADECEVIVETAIQRCTDDGLSRYALSAVRVVPGKRHPWLAATNGKSLAVRPAEGTVQKQCQFPGSLLNTKQRPLAVRRAGERWEAGNTFMESIDGRYPAIEKVAPDVSGRMCLTIDARLLFDIARSLTPAGMDPTVTLLLDPDDSESAIAILAGANGDGFGVLMPLARDGQRASEPEAQKCRDKFAAFASQFRADFEASK